MQISKIFYKENYLSSESRDAITYVLVFKDLGADIYKYEWFNMWFPDQYPYSKYMENKEYYKVILHNGGKLEIYIDPS